MKIQPEQYEQIKDCFPVQRKSAKVSNLDILNALLYVVGYGCKWRNLPPEYGDWHVIYTRVNDWAKKGVLQKVFLRLQQLGIVQIQVRMTVLDLHYNKGQTDDMDILMQNVVRSSKGCKVMKNARFMWTPHLARIK